MKIAIIITGDVRDCFVKNIISSIFKKCDIYVGSYIKHQKYINEFCKKERQFLIDENKDINPPDGIAKENMQQNMLQWLHLDNIINKYESDLTNYDVILKYRFDYFINDKFFLNKISVKSNILYNDSDKVFYADSLTFINVFKNYYNNLKKFTYHKNRDINDDSFETSWRSEPALQMYLKHCNIISKGLQHIPGKIIRGNYNKVLADGNKKLYKNSQLYGKFTKI